MKGLFNKFQKAFEKVKQCFIPISLKDEFKRAKKLIANKWRRYGIKTVYEPKVEVEAEDDIWGLDIDDEDDELWGKDIGGDECTKNKAYYWINSYPLRDPSIEQLGLLQVWNEKDLIIVIPKLLLEEQDLIIQKNERIVISKENYRVYEVLRWGVYLNDVLLIILNCELSGLGD